MTAPVIPEADGSLRARQKSATRDLILEAVGRCLSDRALEALSFADVAQEAGVGLRTVYRYFPTKEALLDAAWTWLHAAIGIDAFPDTAEELIALPARVFPLFDAREGIIRGMLASPQGREVRLAVNSARQAAIRQAVRDGAGDLPEPAFTRLCAAVQLLYSATGWVTMRDYWGLSGEEAGRAAGDAIRTLITSAKAAHQDQRGAHP
jgi:AcrR family transcriptional regulator